MGKTKAEHQIGSKVFAVHKSQVHKQINGAKIIVGRVKTFIYTDKKVRPVVVPVGNPRAELDSKTHVIYNDVEEAIHAISEL